MNELALDPQTTALVIVDLQKGVSFDYKPYSYSQVVENAAKLAREFSRVGACVVCLKVPVTVGKDSLHPIIDAPENSAQLAEMAKKRAQAQSVLVPELEDIEDKHVIVRRQWGGFYGTDLDSHLRRRGIETLILCGVATGFGVDTTAREAYQHNYQQIFAEDAMTAWSEQEQDYVCKHILPMIGRVRTTNEILGCFKNIDR